VIACFGGLWLISRLSDSTQAWQRFGVYHPPQSFADLRFIMSAIESRRDGYDPYRRNPHDLWHRRMNYPRLWMSLSALGLQERHTGPLGVGVALIFYVSLLALVGRLTFLEGAFYSLLVCSPATMLGVERGNVDLLIFSLLTFAVLLIRREGTRSIWPYAVVLVCSVLKLYPICAMAVALRDRSRTVALSIIGGAGAVFLSYLFWIRSDLPAIVANTPQTFVISFGSKVVFLRPNSWVGPINTTAWCIVCLASVVALAIVVFKRTSRPLFSSEASASMLIGMSMYIGIFVFLTNFNYKLIFLIFAAPQMLQWARSRNAYRHLAYIFLAAMALAFWISAQASSVQVSYPQFLLKELMNWSLFGMSTVILLHFVFRHSGSQVSLDQQSSNR
jgi:hypothetical protein